MTPFSVDKSRSKGLTISAAAAAAFIASSGALSAQTIFTMPDDICTWDWASPATAPLLRELKDRIFLVHTTTEMAKNCPQNLCDIDWQSAAASDETLPGEMLCELGHRQLFFDDLVDDLAATCPDVAQMMTELLPEVYDSCGTWPRVEAGGTGGGPAEQDNGEEEEEEKEEEEKVEESGGEGDDQVPRGDLSIEDGEQEIE
jgi:hypothetical protein